MCGAKVKEINPRVLLGFFFFSFFLLGCFITEVSRAALVCICYPGVIINMALFTLKCPIWTIKYKIEFFIGFF